MEDFYYRKLKVYHLAMCQLEIAESRNYITPNQFIAQENNFREISRMIIGLKKSLEIKL